MMFADIFLTWVAGSRPWVRGSSPVLEPKGTGA